jgi:hypothetical protein
MNLNLANSELTSEVVGKERGHCRFHCPGNSLGSLALIETHMDDGERKPCLDEDGKKEHDRRDKLRLTLYKI